MTAKLYWFAMSHPAMAARRMLELKSIDFRLVSVLPGMQRIHLRAAGFAAGTVPALKLDGRRVQGSLHIARALEDLTPEPHLFPRDPVLRRRAEEAERWGEAELQSAPRVIIRWGLVAHLELRRWLGAQSRMPAPGLAARLSLPAARYYARVIGADEAAARRQVEMLPQMLERADALLAEGTLTTAPANAAALQVLSTIRALDAFADLHDTVAPHPSATAARAMFPDYPEPIPPFIPAGWLTRPAPAAP